MKTLILICLTLITTIQIYAQTLNEITSTPHQVMALGRGTAESLDWHPDGEVLAVGARTGIWFYDESLADLAHFEDVDDIIRLAWAPSGDLLATLDGDGKLQVWAVTFEPYTLSLEQSWSFDDADNSYAWYFEWSPDCKLLAVVTASGARVLDVNTSEQLLNIPDVKKDVTWNPDGTRLAGAVDLGEEIGEQVRVWDAMTGETVATYISSESYLYWSDIQWSPDGSVLVGITILPATLHAWDVNTGELLSDVDTFSGEFGAYIDMWWSEGGQQLFTISRNVSDQSWTYLDIWNTANWTSYDRGVNLGDVWKIEKHPKAELWAFLTSDSQILTWSLDESEILQVYSDHSQPPTMLEWSPDSQYIASASKLSKTVQVWNLTESREMQSIARPHQWLDMESIKWTADGAALRAVLEHFQFTAPGTQVTGFVVELDVQNDASSVIQETGGYIPHDGSESILPLNMWSGDFTRVATVVDASPISLFTVQISDNGRLNIDEIISTIDITDSVSKVIWSPDNSMLAIITRDPQGETSAWVYDSETGKLIHRLRPSFPATLYDISWSPDSTMVALVGRRGIAGSGETEYRLDVEAINRSSEEARHILTVLDTNRTFYHTWHPNSHAIAVSLSSGLNIHPIESAPIGMDATPIAAIPDMHVYALAWSPNGKWLAGGHEDGTIRIWNVTTDS